MALPRTLGELQLYRVLQRANLLGYYETFIQQGGDDVQQLCEAGEEEFLEIMALVGMATKPLHVRRLQKALREWASNPGLFSQPVSAVPVSSIPLFKLSEASGRKALSNGHASPSEAAGKGGSSTGTPPARSPTEPGEKLSPSAAPPWPGRSTPESEGGGDEEPGGPPFSPGGSGGDQPAGTEVLEPELARTVAESVERLLQSCPRGGEAELRALMKLNKKLAKAVGHIFQLEDGDRHKEEEIRRHSAIYGRGEARRREGKQLTLHEVGDVVGSTLKGPGDVPAWGGGQGGSGGGGGGDRLWPREEVGVGAPSERGWEPGSAPTQVASACLEQMPPLPWGPVGAAIPVPAHASSLPPAHHQRGGRPVLPAGQLAAAAARRALLAFAAGCAGEHLPVLAQGCQVSPDLANPHLAGPGAVLAITCSVLPGTAPQPSASGWEQDPAAPSSPFPRVCCFLSNLGGGEGGRDAWHWGGGGHWGCPIPCPLPLEPQPGVRRMPWPGCLFPSLSSCFPPPLFATPSSICAKASIRAAPRHRPAWAAAHACCRGWRCPQRGRRPGGHACRGASAQPPPRLTQPVLLPPPPSQGTS